MHDIHSCQIAYWCTHCPDFDNQCIAYSWSWGESSASLNATVTILSVRPTIALQVLFGLTCGQSAGHRKPLHVISVMLHGLVPFIAKTCNMSGFQAQSIGKAVRRQERLQMHV